MITERCSIFNAAHCYIMNDLQELFVRHFGQNENTFAVRAPGRANLIGGHVDYNDGFVMPIALPMSIRLMVRPRADRNVEMYSANFQTRFSFSLDDIEKSHNWLDYVKGVARELASAQVPLHGFEGVILSDVPAASGLSSSAALEVATALAFLHLASQPMHAADIALLCQRAENKFVGVNCGIMDQMAVAACEKNRALLLDCRSLDSRQIPFALENHTLVIVDSGVPRELSASAYNERRAQCEAGLEILQKHLPPIEALRDVSLQEYSRHKDELPTVIQKRVRHVITEIARTQEAAAFLEAGNISGFGDCINASHDSLRDDYEVSSIELDWLVNWSRTQPGVLGARLTGAGFGGCIIALLENAALENYIQNLPHDYSRATGKTARCWPCTAAAGARIVVN
jgi:galactokinase